jgi:hypothetical protein
MISSLTLLIIPTATECGLLSVSRWTPLTVPEGHWVSPITTKRQGVLGAIDAAAGIASALLLLPEHARIAVKAVRAAKAAAPVVNVCVCVCDMVSPQKEWNTFSVNKTKMTNSPWMCKKNGNHIQQIENKVFCQKGN